MATILNIAGHGPLRNGGFDPGATGFITQGEWRYYANSFFDKLKKYEPKGHKVVYHTAYNVYDYGNLVNLARQYGEDVIVIEWHFDASGSASASGGHVIVYSGFAPDALDLRLRDGIQQMVGVRYDHRGHKGISGRSNLANVNRAAHGGINYRLIELGFGTNRGDADTMLNEMDEFARVMSESIYDVELDSSEQQKDTMAGYYVVQRGDTLWGIAQEHGVKVADLKKWNNLDSDLIFPNQSLEVRGADVPMPEPEPKPKETPVAKPSNPVKVGNWIRVPANKLYAQGNANKPVQSRELVAQVDRIDKSWKNPIRLVKNGAYQGFARFEDITGSGGGGSTKKSVDEVAREIAFGNHNFGNGETRKRRLREAGYNPDAVQRRINELLGVRTAQASKGVKVGDIVTARRLYESGNSTKNVRNSNITGYVDAINNSWRNEIRLRNKRGGYYLGFTRKQDLV